MSNEPTDAEVGYLVDLLRTARWETPLVDLNQLARSVLRHYEPRSNEQRCDGSNELAVVSITTPDGNYANGCPGCSRCKPAVKQPRGCGGGGGVINSCDGCGDCNSQPVTTPPVAPVVTEVRIVEDQFRALLAALLPCDWRMNQPPLGRADAVIAAAKEKP